MKRIIVLVCWLALVASVTVAQAQEAGTGKPARHRAAAKKPAVTAAEVQALRDAIAAQQQQIDQLKEQLQQKDQATQQQMQQAAQQAQAAAAEAQAKADQAAAQAAQQQQAVTEIKSDVADLKQNTTNTALTVQETQKDIVGEKAEIKALGNLKMSGDLRLRYEPFWGGGPANGAASAFRNRERFRLRFNINTKIGQNFLVGFSLASGDLGDPVSTNSTETGFYTRKPIAIDKAFATFNPQSFKPLSVTVGKFGYTWQRTELTWDNDLNPEGATETLGWDWKNGFLSHFAVVAIETPIFEVSGGPDSYMTGGQVQAGFKLAPSTKFSANVAYYDFANADTIAQNQAQVPADGFATQGISNTGGGNFGFSASTLSNNFGVINNKRVFASKYGVVDALARLDLNMNSKRLPIYALFDYIQNTEACDNLAAFVAAGVTPPTCDSHQRHGYWSEVRVGQVKNKGDAYFAYTFMRIERDATLSAFDFSDVRIPTNVLEHRVEAYYQAFPHIQFGVTGLIGRQIVNAQSPNLERWLKRWQFDTIFSF
jgi:Putative porin